VTATKPVTEVAWADAVDELVYTVQTGTAAEENIVVLSVWTCTTVVEITTVHRSWPPSTFKILHVCYISCVLLLLGLSIAIVIHFKLS